MILNATNFYTFPAREKNEFVKIEVRVRVMDIKLQ